ncbi:MAG: hypothetical protein AAF720_15815, partial [Pseudomonadota bacterium]
VLIQVPFVLQGLGQKKLGVIAASSTSMNERLYEACDIHNPEQLIIREMQSSDEFKRMIACDGSLDPNQLCDDVCSVAMTREKTEPDIGGILLQCSGLPPSLGQVHGADFCANR